MADLRYIVETDTRRAQQGLTDLQTKTTQTSNSMQNLGRVIAGIGIASFIRSALNAANAVSDLAAATDVSVQNIAALTQAFQENSGSVDGALRSIQRLTRVTGEAVRGNQVYIDSFARLGISLRDLQDQSPDRILERTVVGLGNLESAAERSALAMQLLGRSGGVDLRTIGQAFNDYQSNARRYAQAIESAGAANQQLANTLQQLQREVIVVIQPITEFIAALNPENIAAFIELMLKLVVVFGSLWATLKGVGLLVATSRGLNSLSRQMLVLSQNATTSKMSLLRFAQGTATTSGAIVNLSLLVTRLVPIVAGLSAAYLIADSAVKRYTDDTGLLAWAKSKLGLETEKVADALAREDETVNRALRRWREYDDILSAVRGSQRAIGEFRMSSGIADLARELDLLTNVAREDRQVTLELARATDEYNAALQPLLKSLEQVNEYGEDPEASAVIEESIAAINDLYQEQVGLIKAVNQARKDEADESERLANEQKALEARIRMYQILGQVATDGQNQIAAMNAEMEKLTLGTLEQQFVDIRTEQEAVTRGAQEMLYALYAAGGITLDEYQTALQAVDAMESELIERRRQAAEELYEQQRLFSTGWQQAYNEYAEAAFNNAELARTAFDTATKGMEDALMNFVTTGKLSFRGLITDMIQQLLRLSMQKALAGLLGGIGGAGAGSGIASLFAGGFATGGFIPPGKFGLVGEAGPEFISGPAQITPMDQVSTTGSTQVNYNISAVDARSFKELVASDPSFIYAVTEKGRQTLPTRRR